MDEKINDDFEVDEEPDQSNKQNNDIEDNSENNLEESILDDPVDDTTLQDATDKLPTENENADTRVDSDNAENLEEIERSQSLSGRSTKSHELEYDVINNSELENEINKESLFKLESDPFYVPGDFARLPEIFEVESFPLSYQENSLKEELCLEFVDNFKRQYRHLYGDRKPLFLKPKNECEIEKFVCSYIISTKLPYPEVDYWEGAAKFVSEYLTLVPLIPCTEVPSRLLSPMTTINLQMGTCFEYSTLLCSLLLGVGYNAYVVSGYATREICYMDQSRQHCPFFEVKRVEKDIKIDHSNKRYTIRPPRDLNSKFELEQIAKKEKLLLEEKLKDQKIQEEQELLLEQPKDDPLFGQRIHSWVLVLAGKRGVGENFFIESLTGEACSVNSKEYIGIESLWNNKNYWVNMQLGSGGVGKINFDLNNTMLWEFLLPGQELVTIVPPMEGQVEEDPTDEETDKSKHGEKYFDLPKSWTKPIQINLKDFEQKSSSGRKEILYKKAKLEKYSNYQNIDGMVLKCKTYEDRMLTKPLETVEYFSNRQDKLIKRVSNPVNGMISDFFAKGRKSRLSEHHYFEDKMIENTRKMIFYPDARVDNIIELENSEKQLITVYKNRDDFLVKRLTTFKKREKKFGPANEREYRRPIELITEEYSRNPNILAHKDIHEITFHLSEDRISVSFHIADNNIAGDEVEFIKSNLASESRKENAYQLMKDSYTYFQIDPFRLKLSETETYEYYKYLLEKEEAAKEAVRNEESEMIDILKLRDTENIENTLTISLFDRVRNEKANKTRKDLEKAIEEDKHRTKDAELDYLEPFLLQMNINKDDEVTKEQVIKLYNNCLQDFKDRLINKANLLQARFEKETALLQEKQQWYQQNQNKMLKQDEEEYLQFCNEATFRINTLEKMLARHKQISKYKESDLDKKMKSDKRLANFLLAK